MTRDQRRSQVLRVDVSDGAVEVLATDDDGEWLDVVPGTPRLLPDGRLLRTAELDGTRRLVLDGDPLTPEGLQVDHVIDVDASGVLVSASAEPVEAHVWRVGLDGTCTQLTGSGGYHEAVSSGGTTVLVHREVARPGATSRWPRSRRTPRCRRCSPGPGSPPSASAGCGSGCCCRPIITRGPRCRF
jgi:dipeptidyl-peptidase-4